MRAHQAEVERQRERIAEKQHLTQMKQEEFQKSREEHLERLRQQVITPGTFGSPPHHHSGGTLKSMQISSLPADPAVL